MNKKHGNTGNKNASKHIGLELDTKVVFRCNSIVKSGYVKQANKENLKLSEWIQKELSKCVDDEFL